MKINTVIQILAFVCLLQGQVNSQKLSFAYTVSMDDPEWHSFHVELICSGNKAESIDFKMPVCTPGYYQKMNYAGNVKAFRAIDETGAELTWEKTDADTWRVMAGKKSTVLIRYDISAERDFVATPYLDEHRGYILPAGTFFYVENMLNRPVRVTVKPYEKWSRVATGLDSVKGKRFEYTAPDFDILYDCPILAGNLEELPPFKVRGIWHRFIGFRLGDFDRHRFITDLRKIVETSVNLIGHIPYDHYTFIATGPGRGGIEHLNNTSFGFNGNNLNDRAAYIRTMHFLAHEYFHHYNVKRIRPAALGPFDYTQGNRTKLLWFSEGVTVYYEYLLVRRAGITTDEEMLEALRKNIQAHEKNPGRFFQSLEEASYNTWSDGPFDRSGDELNKTISYYDKGPVAGFVLDMKIRNVTGNKKSLDDLMRLLYKEYYQKRKRGFTDEEFRIAAETIAGTKLLTEFNYISSTDPINYLYYFNIAGLAIDTNTSRLPGTYAGFTVIKKEDSLIITSVDSESPAWKAGLRRGDVLLRINNKKIQPDPELISAVLSVSDAGDIISLVSMSGGVLKESEIILAEKTEKTFSIHPANNLSAIQKQILETWLKG